MQVSEQDPASFIPLPQNWFHILLSLVGAEQHGYGIMQAVLERTNGSVRIWPATLYGSLKRLIADGLIEESDERPVTELDDARRRYYRLTRLGRMALGLAKQECASIGHHGPAIETSHDFTRKWASNSKLVWVHSEKAKSRLSVGANCCVETQLCPGWRLSASACVKTRG